MYIAICLLITVDTKGALARKVSWMSSGIRLSLILNPKFLAVDYTGSDITKRTNDFESERVKERKVRHY